MSFTIDCDICFEPYDPDEHAPLMLVCGHTYCKTCIADIKQRNSQLECPNDRQQDRRQVDDMPKNYIVLEIIERVGELEAMQPKVRRQDHDIAKLEQALQNISTSDYDIYCAGYSGPLADGLRSGYGVLKYSRHDVYEGEFVNDKMHGIGALRSSEGYFFAGKFVEGVRSGYGLQRWESGAAYQGCYEADVFDGFGKITFSDGSFYEGEFVAGNKHGRGVFQWSDGSEYRGSFVDDVFSGFGVMRHADGSVYDGYWENDKKSGKGRLQDSDGNVFVGYFSAGKKHGRGVTKYADGSVYRGSYVHNEKSGRGLYTSSAI
jgi:hypothetical protein